MRIDQFRLVQVVHEGLYGPVYRGLHEKTQQPVALQILRGTQSKPPLQALQAHLQTLQKLAFPGVPVPLGCGLLPDGAAYLASQWIDGQPLSFRNRARTQALRFAQELSACLSATHQHGIHHLQLHPNQVLVRESTEARPRCFVLDLGLCQLLGPPPTPLPAEALDMLAPERRTDPWLTTNAGAADVYSLGKILQGLLGLAQADTPDGLVSGEGFLSVAVREALVKLLGRMLAIEPARRPTMSEVNSRLYGLIQMSAERRRGRGPGRGPGRSDAQGLEGTAPTIDGTQGRGPLSPSPSASEPESARTPRTEPADPLIGEKFANFTLVRKIGSGAMGSVYEAIYEQIHRRAAVKVLKPQHTAGAEYARRFLDEARAVNIIDHPGLVSTFEFGQRADGLLFIVMEYLEGETLESLLKRRGSAMPVRQALDLTLQAAHALSAAHRCGIVHRDIKPSNLMLVRDPLVLDTTRVKILDFGIAKVGNAAPAVEEVGEDHTAAGIMMGTMAYMAPEQYGDAKAVDGRADVFALGMVLYEMLTLSSPFGDASTFTVMGRPARPLSRSLLGQPLSQLVVRMLEREPAARPAMVEVITTLEKLLRPRRWWPFFAGTAVATAVVVMAAGFFFRNPTVERDERQRGSARQIARRLLEGVLLSPSRDAEQRAEAARELGQSHDPLHAALLVRMLGDGTEPVQVAAIEALGELADPRAESPLSKLVTSGLQNGRTEKPERAAALSLYRLHKRSIAASAERPEVVFSERLLPVLRKKLPSKTALPVLLEFLVARYDAESSDGAETASSPAREAAKQEIFALLAAHDIATDDSLPLLKLLGKEGEKAALDRLDQLARRESRLGARLHAAAILRWLGQLEPALEAQLAADLKQNSEYQITAAGLNARLLGERSGCELLAKVVFDAQRGAPQRKQAARGLGACGLEIVLPLVPLLRPDADCPAEVQIALAGSILRVVGPDPDQIAVQVASLSQGLTSARAEDRLGLIELADALPETERTRVLLSALGSSNERVRDAAARGLSARPLLSRLRLMQQALDDANTNVQQAGIKAIVWLLAALRKSNQEVAPVELEPIRARVRDLLAGNPDEALEAVARTLLLQGGDGTQRAPMTRLMQQGSERAKLLLVELVDIKDALLRTALSDRSLRVRFFAARRLVEAGQREGTPELTAMLANPGEEALLAYWILRKAKVAIETPRFLGDLLGRNRAVYTRLDVVRLLGDLPADKALPYLELASHDPSAVVRMAAAASAARLYASSRKRALLDILHALRGDEELVVRRRALALVAELLPASAKEQERAAASHPATPGASKSNLSSSASELRDAGTAALSERSPPPASRDAGLVPDAATPASIPSAKPAQATRPSGPSEAERLEAARHRLKDAATHGQAVGELRKILDGDKPCRGAVCQGAMIELGRALLGQSSPREVAEGLGYLKTLWGRSKSSTPVQLPTRDSIHQQFRNKLFRITIKKPQPGGACAVVLDELYEPGGELQLIRVSPERFFPRPNIHTQRDCCGTADARTETCAAAIGH